MPVKHNNPKVKVILTRSQYIYFYNSLNHAKKLFFITKFMVNRYVYYSSKLRRRTPDIHHKHLQVVTGNCTDSIWLDFLNVAGHMLVRFHSNTGGIRQRHDTTFMGMRDVWDDDMIWRDAITTRTQCTLVVEISMHVSHHCPSQVAINVPVLCLTPCRSRSRQVWNLVVRRDTSVVRLLNCTLIATWMGSGGLHAWISPHVPHTSKGSSDGAFPPWGVAMVHDCFLAL